MHRHAHYCLHALTHLILLFPKLSLLALTVEALYDYDARESDELTIHEGDVLTNCLAIDDGWMMGELNGKQGLFPSNYVKRVGVVPPPGMIILYT